MDNIKRCGWGDSEHKIYRDYHDFEWGIPEYDDDKLFEMLILESFQAGLSWLIILKKRESFREAFKSFDANIVAQFTQDDIDRLMSDTGIVRNRAKILATINNAKVFLEIQAEYSSFARFIWGFTESKIVKNMDNEFRNKTELSDTISKELKKRGMKFMGSITVYSYLQAIGIVNDHELECFSYNK